MTQLRTMLKGLHISLSMMFAAARTVVVKPSQASPRSVNAKLNLAGIDQRGLVVGLLASIAHLLWEYTHGGVQSHHLLARPDLPGASNGWGLIILPFLGWLASRNATRGAALNDAAATRSVSRFLGALLVGLVLSLSFAAGFESVATGTFLISLAIGLILPIYRAEYIFGFVLGMTFVLGAVLPTFAALVGAGISAIAHFAIRPIMARVFRAGRT